MRILTKHEDLNTLKVWENVKAFDPFKQSLETNRELEGKIKYYLVKSKDPITILPDFSFHNGLLKTYCKCIDSQTVTKNYMTPWYLIPNEQLSTYYTEQDMDDINYAKSVDNYSQIEMGVVEAPNNYPVIPMVEVPTLVDEQTEELILEQIVEIEEIV